MNRLYSILRDQSRPLARGLPSRFTARFTAGARTGLAAAVVLGLASGCSLERRGPGAPILDEQKAAPLFVLEDEAGRPTSLDTQLPHGPVVLYFYRGFW